MRLKASVGSVVAVLSLAVTAAACGGSGSQSAGTSAASTTTVSSSSPASGATTSGPSQSVAAEKALAQAANLKLGDLPTGWTANPNPNNASSSSDATIGKQLASCLHVHHTFFRNDPQQADSPEFDDSNGDTAQSTVDYLAGAADVHKAMAVIQSSRFPTCMASAVKTLVDDQLNHPSSASDSLPAGASVGQTTFAAMSFPMFGDASSAFRMTVPITFNGLTVSGYFDIVVVQKGRAAAIMQFFGSGSPLDASLEQQLTTTVTGRLTDT